MEKDAKVNHHLENADDESQDTRTRLVQVRRIVDSSIFGGWGIKL